MRKHNEGYALALVLVVLIVVCLVAVSILTLSVNNLTAQQDSISRMQDEYEAKASVEMIWAKLEEDIAQHKQDGKYHLTDSALQYVRGDLVDVESIGINCPDCSDMSDGEGAGDQSSHDKEVIVEFVVKHGQVSIHCGIKIKGDKITTGYLDQEKSNVLNHIISEPTMEYSVFEITVTDSAADGEESEPA